MKIDESEQWKLDGRCDVCRRKNYCGKKCSRYVDPVKKMVNQYIAEAFIDAAMRRYK